MKTKLFVSYASEDTAFAQSLVDQLQMGDFDVWFAPYVLTLGDSLLRKISEGLSECDYGVVIFSPAFFSKEWPQHELAGLFNLENAKKKMILPIWKDLGKEEIAKHSPILADRIAAQASKGIDAVIREIKVVVAAGNRVASFSGASNPVDRLRSLVEKEKAFERAQALRSTQEGMNLALAAAGDVITKLQQLVSELPQERWKLSVAQKTAHVINIDGPFKMSFDCYYRSSNNVGAANLWIDITQQGGIWNDPKERRDVLKKQLKPDFDPGDIVVWVDGDSRRLPTERIPMLLLSTVLDELEKEQSARHAMGDVN